jgi:hypothetical protein
VDQETDDSGRPSLPVGPFSRSRVVVVRSIYLRIVTIRTSKKVEGKKHTYGASDASRALFSSWVSRWCGIISHPSRLRARGWLRVEISLKTKKNTKLVERK